MLIINYQLKFYQYNNILAKPTKSTHSVYRVYRWSRIRHVPRVRRGNTFSGLYLLVCLSYSGYNSWKPWPRNFIFGTQGTSSEYLGQSWVSRLLGRGQGHSSVTKYVRSRVVCFLVDKSAYPVSELRNKARIVIDDILSRDLCVRVRVYKRKQLIMSPTRAVMMCARVVSVVNRSHVLRTSDSRRREMSTDS